MGFPLRVLIIEDSKGDTLLLLRELRRGGYDVTHERVETANDFEAALARQTWDVVLSDYCLPEFDGLKALAELQVSAPDMPFILVSGAITDEMAVAAMKAGARDYVMKGNLDRLVPVIERELREADVRRERRQKEEALRNSEQRLADLINFLPDAVLAIDRDGKVIVWNHDMEELTGVQAADMIGKSDYEYAVPFYGTRRPILVDLVLNAGDATMEALYPSVERLSQTLITELYVPTPGYRPTGVWLWEKASPLYDSSGNVVGAVEVVRDITERKRADEEIKRLNENLARRAWELTVLNAAAQAMASSLNPEAVLKLVIGEVRSLLDAEGASVLLRDPGSDELVFAAAVGASSEGLVGTRLPVTAGIAGWVMRERRSAMVSNVQGDPRFDGRIDARTGLTTHSLIAVPLKFKGAMWGVVEAINKAGSVFDEHDLGMLEALASSAAVAIENSQLYAVEQRRATALAQALEQQRELDRLQREFIQNVSHELRTPLSLIRGYAELMESGDLGQLQSDQQKRISIIARRARLLSRLVDDIIAVLEIESRELRREPVDLAGLVRDRLAEFQATAEQARVTLVAEIAPDLPALSGDSIALRRGLDNLLNNAFKFTPPGGSVTVHVHRGDEAMVIEVMDTGVGIPQDQLGRIFERFYQVDGSATRRYGGVGLGLALVKGIIEAHGGRITVTSQVGVGTTFTVSLPIGTMPVADPA